MTCFNLVEDCLPASTRYKNHTTADYVSYQSRYQVVSCSERLTQWVTCQCDLLTQLYEAQPLLPVDNVIQTGNLSSSAEWKISSSKHWPLVPYSSDFFWGARSWICVHITIQMLQSPERGFLLKQNTSRVHVMYLTLLTCWFISKSLSSGCKERDQVANKHCSQLQTTHLQHMYKQGFSEHCSMEWTEIADSGLSEEVLKRLFWNLTSRLDFSYGALPWSLAIHPELAHLLSSDNGHLSPSISSILSLELSSPNPTVTLHIINPTLLSLALLSKIQDPKILQQQKMTTIYWHPHINQKKVTAGFAA